jgi:hypothetical protein
MIAELIYRKAETNGVTPIGDCSSISLREWDKLMEDTVRADKRRVVNILVEQGFIEPEWKTWYNPYNCFKSNNLLVFTESAIEHFYKIN